MVPFFTRPEVSGNTRVNFDNEGKGWERIVFQLLRWYLFSQTPVSDIFENKRALGHIKTQMFVTQTQEHNISITTQLNILTVNRKNELKKNYKKNYYKNIKKANKNVIITKILDKLDNLYLLKMNKNLKIKKRYLKEIEDFLMPLIKGNLENLYLYFKNLIEFSKQK